MSVVLSLSLSPVRSRDIFKKGTRLYVDEDCTIHTERDMREREREKGIKGMDLCDI